eukprot:RCo008329
MVQVPVATKPRQNPSDVCLPHNRRLDPNEQWTRFGQCAGKSRLTGVVERSQLRELRHGLQHGGVSGACTVLAPARGVRVAALRRDPPGLDDVQNRSRHVPTIASGVGGILAALHEELLAQLDKLLLGLRGVLEVPRALHRRHRGERPAAPTRALALNWAHRALVPPVNQGRVLGLNFGGQYRGGDGGAHGGTTPQGAEAGEVLRTELLGAQVGEVIDAMPRSVVAVADFNVVKVLHKAVEALPLLLQGGVRPLELLLVVLKHTLQLRGLEGQSRTQRDQQKQASGYHHTSSHFGGKGAPSRVGCKSRSPEKMIT